SPQSLPVDRRNQSRFLLLGPLPFYHRFLALPFCGFEYLRSSCRTHETALRDKPYSTCLFLPSLFCSLMKVVLIHELIFATKSLTPLGVPGERGDVVCWKLEQA